MAQFRADQPQRETPPFILLGTTIEDLFVQQYDRIAFHNNEEQNEYRKEEGRLSLLMLDKTLTDEKRMTHANTVISLTEKYEGGFLRSLHALNADIDRQLAAMDHEIEALARIQDSSADLRDILSSLNSWISLSKQLQSARLVASQTVSMRVDCDKILPNIVIRNQGRADVMLSAEEATIFQRTLTEASAMLKQSSEDNERIETDRLPLARTLFGLEVAGDGSPVVVEPPPQLPAPQKRRMHPLEGKSWFRFAKIVYICLWLLAGGLCLIVATAEGGWQATVGGGLACVLILIALRKAFYYVTLGRTTVSERPGTGYFDLDELCSDFDSLRASNPELYKSLVTPFLVSWKQQYGRRIPTDAYEVFRRRLDAEIEELRTKKKKVIDDAAKKGTVIEISALKARLEKSLPESQGPDRAAQIRGLNEWIITLEAKYGTSIPVDEAAKILEDLEQNIQKDGG